MAGPHKKLIAAVEAYFAELGRVRASGGATEERSYGPVLEGLLRAVGATLKPKLFCVQELANQGAGRPDFALYTARQVQKGRPRPGQIPECGVVEVKGVGDDAWLTAGSDQVSRYWDRYRLMLVTNLRDFVLVGADGGGGPVKLEAFELAEDADDFRRKVETPRAFAHKVGRGLGEYQARALSHRAALAEPKDLAWLLASYARDGLARGQRLAALLDPEFPVSGVTRAPLRPAIATITVPTDVAGRNMAGDDFPVTAQAGVTSERLAPQCRERAASSNAPICRRNPPPWGTRCPHPARQPLIPT